jgi:predicted nucleic acid-binding Zn ribbon protein
MGREEELMSRRPTRQLTWQFVLRTFKRVEMISRRYSSDARAKALVERGVEIPSPQYMDDIWQLMCKLKKAAGVDPGAHPNGNCPQCGHDIGRDHNGARYCSTRCRQRAWRERRAAAQGRNAAPGKRRRRFNRVRDEMKRRVAPLEDASIAPGDETSATRGGVTS